MSKKRSHGGGHHKPAHEAAHHGEKAHAQTHAHEHEDEVIHVPKGQSRLKFYLSFGLVLFLLIIFVVPGALMNSLTAGTGKGEELFCSWTLPGQSARELLYVDFIREKRGLRVLERLYPYLGMADFDPREDFNTVRFLLLEDLAQSSGIRVTDQDLASAVLALFGGPESYRAGVAAQFGSVTLAEFEAALRRALLVQRLRILLGSGAAGVEPTEIEDVWKLSHQEFAFDYVQVAAEDFDEAARAEVPADEELEAWLDERSPFEKAKYNTPLRWSAEVAYVPLSDGEEWGFDGSALLEKHPRPEEEEPDEKALQYYNSFRYTRFRRPEPLEEPEEGVDPNYFPYEEVEEVCKREAPVYYSLSEWFRELTELESGEALISDVDLAAEAQVVGLVVVPADQARTKEEWEALEEPWSGGRLAASLRDRQSGQLTPLVINEEGALVVGRVVERLDPDLPPFAEIRDQVADDWVAGRRAEIAVERLEAVRDLLGERPPEPEPDPETGEIPDPVPFLPNVTQEEFAQAAQESGFEARRRDYEERTMMLPPGGEEPDPIDAFLRFNAIFYAQAEGDVPEANSGLQKDHAFLVRVAGTRDADTAKMKPSEYAQSRNSLVSAAVQGFFAETFDSRAYLEENYLLYLYTPEEEVPVEPQAPAE